MAQQTTTERARNLMRGIYTPPSSTEPTQQTQTPSRTPQGKYYFDPERGVKTYRADGTKPSGMVEISKSEYESIVYDPKLKKNVVRTQEDLDQIKSTVEDYYKDNQELIIKQDQTFQTPIKKESPFKSREQFIKDVQEDKRVTELKEPLKPVEPVYKLQTFDAPKTKRERLERWISQTRTEAQLEPTDIKTGIKSVGAGVALSGLMTYDFFKSIPKVLKPVEEYAQTKEQPKGPFSALTFASQEVAPYVPTVIITAPALISSGLSEAGTKLRTEPAFTLGFAGSEIAQFLYGGKAISGSTRVASRGLLRFDPRYTPLTDEGIKLKSTSPLRETLTITEAGPVSSISEPLSKQVQIAGKKIDAVSAQRGLFSPFEKMKTVDKPLPTPDSPPLERAFFADPYSRVRISRLGVTDTPKEATISDIFKGDFQFRKAQPQILLFEETKVASIPAELANVERKLKIGAKVTPAEEARFIDWQLKPTQEFKPIGFISKRPGFISSEPEVILAPGEVIKKVNVAGFTEVKGVRTPIIRAKVGELSPNLRRMLGESDSLTPKLKSQIAKETGFTPTEISYRLTPQKPVVGLDIASLPVRTSRSLGVSSKSYFFPVSPSPSLPGPSFPVSPSPSIPSQPMPSLPFTPSPSISSPPLPLPVSPSPSFSSPMVSSPSPMISSPMVSSPMVSSPALLGKEPKPFKPIKPTFDNKRTKLEEEDFFQLERIFKFTPDIQAIVLQEKGASKLKKGVYTGLERRFIQNPKVQSLDYLTKRKVKKKAPKKKKKKKQLKPQIVFSRWKNVAWKGI